MKTTYKIIIICLGIILFVVIGIYSGLMGGGSYSNAQQYDFNIPDSLLAKTVEKFKNDNPDFKIPNSVTLPDGNSNYKYHFYIYDSRGNKLIHCFIIPQEDSLRSSIYLDAINDGLVLGNWKVVNRDFERKENLEIKKEFKTKFLDKLKLPFHEE